MSNSKIYFVFFVLFLFAIQAKADVPDRAGWWKFDNPANLTSPEPGFGVALQLIGSQSPANGPSVENGAVLIGPGSYYKMNHSIAPNGGGNLVNEYSILIDFKVPGNGIWHSFFQTTITNNNDGEYFINPSGNIGVAAVGYSSYSVVPNEWYRLVISVKNGNQFKSYLDGNPLITGVVQAVDERFSLDSLLLLFADENGEDGSIYCSEISIWDRALDSKQALELGGFGHNIGPFSMTRIPYLQSPGQNSMVVCWHDTSATGTGVEYGLDSNLGTFTSGTSEIVNEPYRWHSVHLTSLTSNTQYFYKVISGDKSSEIYSFKTLPENEFSGKLRFLLLSDTHCPDTSSAAKVLHAAKSKISDLYGPDIENNINAIIHSGDVVVSGNSIEQYSTQFFRPLSVLSANIPTMVVAGNHEGESPYFYSYLKLDELSAFPGNPALNEKIWSLRVGNSVFIGLNTNITNQYGNVEANWLNTKLLEIEQDPGIDFVFIFFHHPPFSELWFDVSNDGGSNYVKNTLFPILKNYTKVQQIHTGHTHGFERGTIQSDNTNADFRIICGGGGGGALDTWGAFTNYDYPDIHIAYDHYMFQILEVDMANHSYQNSMYSLGTLNKPRNSENLDSWYKKLNQPQPDTPSADNAEIIDGNIHFYSSVYSGVDSLMTVEMQLLDSSDNTIIVLDSLIHWTNIYGVDQNLNPIDKNKNINPYQIKIPVSDLSQEKQYFFRVRYRDHNLKWSDWSSSFLVDLTGINNKPGLSDVNFLYQNFPNPFKHNTIIKYKLSSSTEVNLLVYNAKWQVVKKINVGIQNPGTYTMDFNSEDLCNGIYFYKIDANNYSSIRKMVKIL